tara:strand:- start:4672 stop:5718 length:1047 start_codon:yes stop_codon:yes gene_type:complete
MFSFEKGKPLFYLVDNLGKKVETIYYTKEKRGGKAAIEIEDPTSVLTEADFRQIKRKHRFSEFELAQLQRVMKRGGGLDNAESGVQARAMKDLNNIINDRLKKSLIFDDPEYDGFYLVPALEKDSYTVFEISGPSGSGKSTIASQIIWHNMRRTAPIDEDELEEKLAKMSKKRAERYVKRLKKDTGTIFLLSRQTANRLDPALKKLEKYIEHVDVYDVENLPCIEDFADSWVLVDDIEGLPKQVRDEIQDLIDALLTCGRRLNIKILISSHNPSGWRYRHVKNEARMKIAFPKTSKNKIFDWLRLNQKWPSADINRFFSESRKDNSHRAFFGLSFPSFYATDKRIQLL